MCNFQRYVQRPSLNAPLKIALGYLSIQSTGMNWMPQPRSQPPQINERILLLFPLQKGRQHRFCLIDFPSYFFLLFLDGTLWEAIKCGRKGIEFSPFYMRGGIFLQRVANTFSGNFKGFARRRLTNKKEIPWKFSCLFSLSPSLPPSPRLKPSRQVDASRIVRRQKQWLFSLLLRFPRFWVRERERKGGDKKRERSKRR